MIEVEEEVVPGRRHIPRTIVSERVRANIAEQRAHRRILSSASEVLIIFILCIFFKTCHFHKSCVSN